MRVRTMKKFTCDALVRRAAEKRKQVRSEVRMETGVPKREPADLNEIHRRFWARLRGEE
jgi:hypothetical protein